MSDKKVAESKVSVADQIWSELKDRNINMFALTGAKVSDYCQPVSIEPTRCFLLFKASSVLPALEEAAGKDYQFEVADKYIIVSRAKKSFGV